MEIVRKDSFWEQNQAVARIACEVEESRGWFLGCECHALECIDTAVKGGTFHCPNGKKSQKGPYAREYLERRLNEWKDTQSRIVVDREKG